MTIQTIYDKSPIFIAISSKQDNQYLKLGGLFYS
jgi:hypothetical protein